MKEVRSSVSCSKYSTRGCARARINDSGQSEKLTLLPCLDKKIEVEELT